jgi:C4-dicarboxylate transport system (C4-dicarboxylate-binding protein)
MNYSVTVLFKGFPAMLGLGTVALIQGAGHHILFDTGNGYIRPQLKRILQDEGLSVDQIDTVVLSHLHWDHTFNVDFFPHAKYILSAVEWEYANKILPKDCIVDNSALPFLRNADVYLVEQDGEEIFPGIQAIRIVQNPIYAAAFTACGANPVPMAPAEVYTALQNGTVDGNCLSINGIYGFGWYELQNTYMIANMFFCALPLVMSKTVFDGMPEAYQQAIMEAGAYACEANHTSSEEQEATNLAIMQEAGIKVTYPEDINEWISLMQDEVYPQFTDTIPEEEIEQVRAMAPA